MLCHGQLAQERPSPRHLTEFYFWLAFGGMVGGLFNTLAAPVLFSRVVEYPLALALVAFCVRPTRATAGPRLSIDRALPVSPPCSSPRCCSCRRSPRAIAIVLAALATLSLLAMTRRHRPLTLAAVSRPFLLVARRG